MSAVTNAETTKKDIDDEIRYSKFVDLLQDASDTIENLIEAINDLEAKLDEKDDEIKILANELFEAREARDHD